MTKPTGPLHPLLIPNQCSNSNTIDFIGPLPLNDGFNAIVTITDRLGSDIQIAATHQYYCQTNYLKAGTGPQFQCAG